MAPCSSSRALQCASLATAAACYTVWVTKVQWCWVVMLLLLPMRNCLTHWGRMTHICVNNPTIIGSDNGLSPSRRQAIIWTNAGILLIETLGTNFSEILIEILTFSFKKMRLKVSSAKRWPFCLGLNVLTRSPVTKIWKALTLIWRLCKWAKSSLAPPLPRGWVYMDESSRWAESTSRAWATY